eukprot:COSAG01_NODE_425_length_17240_cov_29.899306_18_plen_39_part_00
MAPLLLPCWLDAECASRNRSWVARLGQKVEKESATFYM